jgi:hypothetical protein
VRANVICPGFVRTPRVDMQIPEQAKALRISEEQVIKGVMLKDSRDARTPSAQVARTETRLPGWGGKTRTQNPCTSNVMTRLSWAKTGHRRLFAFELRRRDTQLGPGF